MSTDIREIFAEIVETTVFEEVCEHVGLNDLKCILDTEITGEDKEILRDIFIGFSEIVNDLQSVIADHEKRYEEIENKGMFFEVPIVVNGLHEIELEETLSKFASERNIQTCPAVAMIDGSNVFDELRI